MTYLEMADFVLYMSIVGLFTIPMMLIGFLIDGLSGGNILGLYYWIIILAITLVTVLVKYVIKNSTLQYHLNISFWWSQILTWVSYLIAHLCKYQGGFPIKAMIYPPCSPCGGDAPPFDTLPLLFVNIAIWRLISYGILLLIPSRIKYRLWFKRLTYILGIIVTIYGFGMLIWIFD